MLLNEARFVQVCVFINALFILLFCKKDDYSKCHVFCLIHTFNTSYIIHLKCDFIFLTWVLFPKRQKLRFPKTVDIKNNSFLVVVRGQILGSILLQDYFYPSHDNTSHAQWQLLHHSHLHTEITTNHFWGVVSNSIFIPSKTCSIGSSFTASYPPNTTETKNKWLPYMLSFNPFYF